MNLQVFSTILHTGKKRLSRKSIAVAIHMLIAATVACPVGALADGRPQPQAVRSNELSVESLQSHLKARAASWRAARTGVSDLDAREKRMLLGASVSDVRTGGDYGQSSRFWDETLPERYDWRSVNGVDFVTPVKNQGRCGSCVAFATVSVFETQMNIATQSVLNGWTFSPQHLFSCGGGSCSAGWFPTSAVDYLNRQGLPEDACFPYVSGALGTDTACKKTCVDAKQRSLKADMRVRSQRVLGASVDDVKKALLNGPLLTTMKVFDDFYHYSSGVYRHQKGGVVGGHAVMIIGWSNEDQAWIVRNSWGTDWGEQGDFRIAWDDPSGVGGLFFGLDPVKGFSGLVLDGIRDEQTVRQPVDLLLRAQNLSYTTAALEIRGASQKELVTRPFDTQGRVSLNPQDLADGVYTLQARAQLSDGSQRISQARIIFVRKGPLTASIKIERMKPNMNVWEKIVPQFSVTSQPTPVAQIRYLVVNEKGVIFRVRKAEHTAEKVAISFNPAGIPVGRYTLVAEALSDEGQVVASDRLPFNITER